MKVTHNKKTGRTCFRLNWTETRQFLHTQAAFIAMRKTLAEVGELTFTHFPSEAEDPDCVCAECERKRQEKA